MTIFDFNKKSPFTDDVVVNLPHPDEKIDIATPVKNELLKRIDRYYRWHEEEILISIRLNTARFDALIAELNLLPYERVKLVRSEAGRWVKLHGVTIYCSLCNHDQYDTVLRKEFVTWRDPK